MNRSRPQAGFTLVEMLVSLAAFLLMAGPLAALLVQNAQANKAEQMTVQVQADARNCMLLIENALRTAGWDPRNAGFGAVSLDPSPSGPDNYIEIFADLNEDGDTGDTDEDVTIRHHENRIEWRRTGDTSQPFVVLAEGITNDADGDGTIEPMFTPNSTSNPTSIAVKITAESPMPDPRTGRPIRCTVSSDVALRGQL
jgi:prepilin-type N-terminal cleavage/methylation domain-containing protein